MDTDLFLPLIPVALVVAAAAAVRSTWSPCGLSMLSTVTPLAEAGRGHRYRWTASWYFVGALTGGATTGVVAAAVAALVRAAGLSTTTVASMAAAAAVCAAALDGRWLGPTLPHHRRQVNEDWLGRYRAWVYGAGFGWQIGTGVATYIMTAGVYLVVVLAALTADPLVAVLLCVAFGGFRGSMVLIGATITSAERLRRAHERIEAWREPVRRTLVVVLACAAAVLAIAGGATPAALALAATVACALIGVMRRGAAAPLSGDGGSVPVERTGQLTGS